MVLFDPDSSGTDKTFAAFGLYAGGVALVALAGFTIAPVVAVTAVIAGIAAAGYAIWQVLPAIGDAARAAWEWTSARASDAWGWTTDRASDAWGWTSDRLDGAGDVIGGAWDEVTGFGGSALETVGGWFD
jgi:hypothetical protein